VRNIENSNLYILKNIIISFKDQYKIRLRLLKVYLKIYFEFIRILELYPLILVHWKELI